mmetsp:Transcript_12841/g.46940  ORF Transcript_12841/g.46940 Transcript_12841/m.46940 type:complete len:215 (+) Transcript_12841:2430-3074(+)
MLSRVPNTSAVSFSKTDARASTCSIAAGCACLAVDCARSASLILILIIVVHHHAPVCIIKEVKTVALVSLLLCPKVHCSNHQIYLATRNDNGLVRLLSLDQLVKQKLLCVTDLEAAVLFLIHEEGSLHLVAIPILYVEFENLLPYAVQARKGFRALLLVSNLKHNVAIVSVDTVCLLVDLLYVEGGHLNTKESCNHVCWWGVGVTKGATSGRGR